jgi:hypothetical protein
MVAIIVIKVFKALDIGYFRCFERSFFSCPGCTSLSIGCKMASTYYSRAACNRQHISQSSRKSFSSFLKVNSRHHHKTQLRLWGFRCLYLTW